VQTLSDNLAPRETVTRIPVIDLFAGPGGLGEGFTALDSGQQFHIGLSVEMEPTAHRTLTLRAFFRQFPCGQAPDAYYAYVCGRILLSELIDAHPAEWRAATAEARCAELGVVPHAEISAEIDERLGRAGQAGRAVLIGGPPCQAYSLVGRARMRPGREAEFEADHRHFLYREYLRILADHAPAVFVLENVKGLLSSRHGGELMFRRITSDLRAPGQALGQSGSRYADVGYRLVALGGSGGGDVSGELSERPEDYLLRAEVLGLPQARHRVIIIGVREDLSTSLAFPALPPADDAAATVLGAIGDLPPLRSGLSKDDSRERWASLVRGAAKNLAREGGALRGRFRELARAIEVPELDRGDRFLEGRTSPRFRPDWYVDPRLPGVLNHETRGHMDLDLHRYLFAAVYGETYGRAPRLDDFPEQLLPAHRNVDRALATGLFADRFRVQVASRPSTTITSHISRDGHYFIHPDPAQCRSLTVREAARLQTFPDNYFFEGPRTQQYVQVGNAVPPLLAAQVARVVLSALDAADAPVA